MSAPAICLLIAAFIEGLTLAVLIYGMVNRRRIEVDFNRASAHRRQLKKCLLIRPCAGDEAELLDCLLSIDKAKCDFPIRIIIGVDDPNDKAFPAAEAAVSALLAKGFDISLAIAPVIGPNRKVSIVTECAARAGNDVDAIIVADSNIDLSGFDLNRLVAYLFSDPKTGAVWSPFFEDAKRRAFGNTASEAVLHFSWHSFGLLSSIDPGGMVGKLFAVRKDALDSISGFRTTVRFLGEDMALCRALRKSGFLVKVAPLSVRSPCAAKSLKDMLSRQVRWMTVIKAQRPALLLSYPVLFFNALTVYAASAILGLFHPVLGCSLLGVALLLRLFLGYTAARMLYLKPRPAALITGILIADGLMLIAFFKTLGTRGITWRGRALTIGKAGELEDCHEK